MSTVRLRRLGADFARLKEYVRLHPRVRLIQAQGDPPERYQLEYRIRSLRMVGGDLEPVESHMVEIALPLNYPRTPPQCRMLSPVFHPNIAPHAICVGDHWSAGESLQSIVTRIGEMLAYQSYNVKSPLNGEAARWVEGNKHLVPLDPVSMLVEEEHAPPQSPSVSASPLASPPPPNSAATASVAGGVSTAPAVNTAVEPPAHAAVPKSQSHIDCPACGASYRLTANLAGRKVRCTKCEQVFDVPAA